MQVQRTPLSGLQKIFLEVCNRSPVDDLGWSAYSTEWEGFINNFPEGFFLTRQKDGKSYIRLTEVAKTVLRYT